MFSALKKLARSNDDRCPAPMPMSSSLQKKFSRGVHFNMKILIKGDRNVGKSCLLQRLQGGPFTDEYVPTEQIQVAPIHWTYKNTDYIVKVEVWEVVDKGKAKKKPPLGLKLENQTPVVQDDDYETPVLDATFLDVYKNASGVILMLDITKPWTFEYVIKELAHVPVDLPVVVLGNHCDMQHHRQVHTHHIDQALHHAKLIRSAPVRYAESSMRNGFGLRLLHKFLSVPFLRLQKTSLLEQLQRNQMDMEDIEKELDDFQNSDEAHYNVFLDRLANKRRQSNERVETRVISDRSPSIVLGAGKPIVPPNVNPLFAQSLNPKGIKAHHTTSPQIAGQNIQNQYVSPDLLKHKQPVSLEMTPSRQLQKDSGPGTPTGTSMSISASSGALEEFYAGALDSSFLEDLAPLSNANQEVLYELESDDEVTMNPKVTVDEDDLEVENSSPTKPSFMKMNTEYSTVAKEEHNLENMLRKQTIIDKNEIEENKTNISNEESNLHLSLNNDFPIWIGDSSYRRSPEGGEDPDFSREPEPKVEKKHKKKKCKDKDKAESGEKSERKEKKNKHKKSKNEKRNPQHELLAATVATEFDCEEYDSI